jgi:hypothetical protein
MERYKNLHVWMIAPMILMQLGIFMDYWGDFSDNAWAVHVHYWTGTIWYLFLIIQPYYATHGQLERHRTNGIIGIFLAGGVGITALSMMYRDLVNAHRSLEFPDRFGFFKPWFFYGVTVVEVVMMSAFIYAVIQGIIHRKKLEHHAWWLISTVFIIMMPALARGIQFAWFKVVGIDSELEVMLCVFLTEGIILSLAMLAAINYGKLRHPATYLIIGVNLFNCLIEPLGKSESVQAFLEAIIKG